MNEQMLIQDAVCPTYVGMNRIQQLELAQAMCMPHVCGDEPLVKPSWGKSARYAPRMWG